MNRLSARRRTTNGAATAVLTAVLSAAVAGATLAPLPAAAADRPEAPTAAASFVPGLRLGEPIPGSGS